jgi:hypothetical protein
MIGGPAYQYYGPCGVTKVKDSLKEISDIMNRWEDAESIASSTSRVSLSGPVADLQAIQRDAEKLTMPGCMTPIKEKLTHAMEYSIKGYLAFMQEATDSTVGIYFDQAGSDMAELADLILVVKACAPNCGDMNKPTQVFAAVNQSSLTPTKTNIITKTVVPTKTSNYCNMADINNAINELSAITKRLHDALNTANSTNRTELSNPIDVLKQIKSDTENLEVPQCMQPIKEKYIKSMDYDIQGYSAFMKDANDTRVNDYSDQSQECRKEVETMLNEIIKCDPNCENLSFSYRASKCH